MIPAVCIVAENSVDPSNIAAKNSFCRFLFQICPVFAILEQLTPTKLHPIDMFSQEDLHQFEQIGVSAATVEKQLLRMKNGFPHLQIVAAATPRNGIIKLTEHALKQYSDFAEEKLAGRVVAKFVPASGAASRMFKMLYTALEQLGTPGCDLSKILGDKDDFYSFANFIHNISRFGFYNDLEIVCANNNTPLRQLINSQDYKAILELLLTENGLNYGNLPKGLLKFHRYTNYNRTAAEEHLVEGAQYARNADGTVRIHFTVSDQHTELFKAHIAAVLPRYEQEMGVRYDISFSVQKPHTDTVAADDKFEAFRSGGKIVFRPAGHGALLENLADITADIIFIKNIDNVVTDTYKAETARYKKALAAVVAELQVKIKLYADYIAAGKEIDEQLGAEIQSFIENSLGYRFSPAYRTMPCADQRAYIARLLNRPLRVCGMVQNNGEPGGGPFWVANPDGSQSLQIIEKAQIDTKNAEQNKLLASATHFNPVDLAVCRCGTDGKLFNFKDFVDENAGIISKKSQNGKDLYALELPGLWNGGMADWNTAFVEVPIITFNPVKEVNDLLRNEHI